MLYQLIGYLTLQTTTLLLQMVCKMSICQTITLLQHIWHVKCQFIKQPHYKDYIHFHSNTFGSFWWKESKSNYYADKYTQVIGPILDPAGNFPLTTTAAVTNTYRAINIFTTSCCRNCKNPWDNDVHEQRQQGMWVKTVVDLANCWKQRQSKTTASRHEGGEQGYDALFFCKDLTSLDQSKRIYLTTDMNKKRQYDASSSCLDKI
jgi:hypothetical protein